MSVTFYSKMPPSGADAQATVKWWLGEVLEGREDPEGFFAMCVSILGHLETRSQFLSLIEPLSTGDRLLHASLTSIYQEYFTKVSKCFSNRSTFRLEDL